MKRYAIGLEKVADEPSYTATLVVTRPNDQGAWCRAAEAEMVEQLLADAMGLLHNHMEDNDSGWHNDYLDVCKRYDKLIEGSEK